MEPEPKPTALAHVVDIVAQGQVLGGQWEDRYTGRRLTSPADLQIDLLLSAMSTAVYR